MQACFDHNDSVFAALGDLLNRLLIEHLTLGDRTADDIVETVLITKQRIHGRMLRLQSSGLLSLRKASGGHVYRLFPEGLRLMREFLERLPP